MGVTEEELNFLRFYFLNLKIASKAVRVYFDYVHPPAGLSSELANSSVTLKGLRFMTKLQLNILYPSSSQKVTSADFDTTLIVCLLRNMAPRESAPVTGWDNLPLTGDTSTSADLARVKWYRNKSVHSKDGILSSTDFNQCWGDLEGAIGRLSAKGGLPMLKEAQLAKHVVLDGSLTDILLELRSCKKSQEELTDMINTHQSAIDILRSNKEEQEQKIHQVNVSHQKGEAETQKLTTELSDYKNEYTEKLEACKNEIKKNEEMIKQLKDKSDKKQNKIADLISHICKLEIKYKKHDKMFKEHDEHLAMLDEQGSNQGQQIAQQGEQLAQHCEQIAQQSEQITKQGEQMEKQGRSNQTRLEEDIRALIEEDVREGTFVSTKAVTDGLLLLKQNGVLLITGYAGTGKSRTGRHILHMFCTDNISYKCMKLNALNEWEDMVRREHNVVVFLDDIFGETNCIYNREKDTQILDKVHAYVYKGNIKVIITIRDTVKRQCQEVFDSHRLFKFDFIDLSSKKYLLSREEKITILTKYMRAVRQSDFIESKGYVDCNGDLILKNKDVWNITSENPVKGFPLVVYQFVHNDKYFKLGNKFFDRPTEAMLEEMNAIRRKGRSNQTRLEDDVVPTEIKLMSDKSSVPIYLKLLESGSEKKRDIRLVIVGKKGAGKTSLLKRLFGEELGAVDSTNGIEIHRIKCKTRSTDVNWRKISGNNEEFERNSRLLIPYRERLKCQKEVAESHATQSNQHEEKVTTHHIGTVETSEQGVDRNSINDNTILSSEEILYSRTASDQPEKVSLRISHKTEKLVSHVTVDETEKQQSNLSVDQANEEIKEMLNSEVDFNDKNEYATLLLWDFAGDKEFYHTHQTFLSPDSIYVVVTNLNEADNKEAQGIFRLWMDSIHCYCRPNEFSYISNNDTKSISEDPFDPPVILVGTWKDQVQNPAGEEIMDVCHESLYKFAEDVSEDACRHIRDEYTHFVSNTDDDDTAFQPLREHILQLARTMKTWNTNYPLKFIQLEKRLQEKKKELPIVSLHDLKLITSETQNPLNNEELMLFLKFHHEIRALIFFEDLSDYIILDAQWLSDAFKVVVTAKKFQKKSMKNRRKWDEFYSSGKLHSFVLKDMFKNQPNMLSEYKDYILNVMEKFDIIIRPNILDKDTGHEESCYYVPCIITHEPDCDIYTMLNATADTCQRSTWLCFKFTFLPPHLMNHLIASLCRRYKIAELVDSRQTKKRIALFKGTVVFDVDKLTELQKLLVITRSDLIQMQILEFGTNVVFGKGVYKLITKFVTKEINKIINTRFKMTNLKFSKKWECGLAQPDSVTGSRDFGEQHIIEYNCGMCRQIHKAANEWSDQPPESLGCIHHAQGSDPQTETLTENKTVISTKVYVKGITSVSTNVSGVAGSGDTNNKLSNEEKNFTRMGMTALNILADVLYDLLKLDGQNVYSRGEYDITKLYNEHRNLNKHKPSNSSNRFRGPWGGAWQNIHNTDTAVGDDIERIRLTRNELQHSATYALGDTRFNELCDITHDMLRRFDQHNRPKKLYSCRFKEVLATIISDEEAKNVRQQFECKMDTETVFQIEVSNELYKPPTKKTKHQN